MEGPKPGFCAKTEAATLCASGRDRGSWSAYRLSDCFTLCAGCPLCNYISHSRADRDCSWYQSCDFSNLHRAAHSDHSTWRVRDPNGTAIIPATALLPAQALTPRPRRRPAHAEPVLFHEQSAELQYLHSTLPSFSRSGPECGYAAPAACTPALFVAWQQHIRRALPQALRASRPHAGARWPSCAVVGSSRALLKARAGGDIDAHAAVFRVNKAPTRGFEASVGARTDVRVWGFRPLPDEWPDFASEALIVLYCAPVSWVGQCWNWIPLQPRPRFGAYEWQRVLVAIHDLANATPHVEKGRRGMRGSWTFPSSGAMAVWLALAECGHVSVFGFGPSSDCTAWAAPGARPLAPIQGFNLEQNDTPLADPTPSARVRAPRRRPLPSLCDERAIRCVMVAGAGQSLVEDLGVYYNDGDDAGRRKLYGHHAMASEWQWLRRMNSSGSIFLRSGCTAAAL
jgi:hypothetical protein